MVTIVAFLLLYTHSCRAYKYVLVAPSLCGIMKLLMLAGHIALLCAVVNAAALTDKERNVLEQLADELHYQETNKEQPGYDDEQRMDFLNYETTLKENITLEVLVQ